MMKTALTIGFFDGVHLGHRTLLLRLRQHAHATILTFSNHPQEILRPPAPKLLMPLSERIAQLKLYADEVLVLPFTETLAATSFAQLLSQFDLSHLLLGSGSAFGKNREGTEANVRDYAAARGINVEYLPKVLIDGEPVSSSRIRRALAAGDLTLAHQLLGKT